MTGLAIVGPGGRFITLECPPRNRRRTDLGGHVSNVRPSVDDCNPRGLPRPTPAPYDQDAEVDA